MKQDILDRIIDVIRADGVLSADTITPVGVKFGLTVGRYYTACDKPAYAFYCNNRRSVYKSPRHAAQAFRGAIGSKAVEQAIARYQESA